MSTEFSPLKGPNTSTIFRGVFDAIRASPFILGLFLISGLLRYILPPFIDSTVRVLLIPIGVVIAYHALGGRTRTDSPFVLRLFLAFLATLASYLLLILGVLAILLPGLLGWIVFLVLIPLGLYVYTRLFLSTPAVMIDGYGPAEALSVSWELMNGSVLATAFVLALVFVLALGVLISVLLFIPSRLILNVGGVLILDTFLAGMQAFLYSKLAETS